MRWKYRKEPCMGSREKRNLAKELKSARELQLPFYQALHRYRSQYLYLIIILNGELRMSTERCLLLCVS